MTVNPTGRDRESYWVQVNEAAWRIVEERESLTHELLRVCKCKSPRKAHEGGCPVRDRMRNLVGRIVKFVRELLGAQDEGGPWRR